MLERQEKRDGKKNQQVNEYEVFYNIYTFTTLY